MNFILQTADCSCYNPVAWSATRIESTTMTMFDGTPRFLEYVHMHIHIRTHMHSERKPSG